MKLKELIQQYLNDKNETNFKLVADEFTSLENLLKSKSTEIENLSFINRLDYFLTIFNIMNISYNEDMATLTITELANEIDSFETSIKNLQISEEKMKLLNQNFFVKDGEIWIVIKSDIGYYIIYFHPSEVLRVFNLTSKKNGYHIFDSWNFCSWNTFNLITSIAKTGDIYSMVLSLVNILVNYDDKAYHLAKPEDFEKWKFLDKSKKWTEEDFNTIEKCIIWKTNYFFDSVKEKISNDAKSYFNNEIDWLLAMLEEKIN